MTESSGVPIVGPVEPWSPQQETAGPAQDPDGRTVTPDPVRPSGTISVPCPVCFGSGFGLRECQSGPAASTPCLRCKGEPGRTVEVFWKTSGRNHQSHVFQVLGGGVAEGICGHSIKLFMLVDGIAQRGACFDCTMKLVQLVGLSPGGEEWRAPMG